ncbi:MAG: DNA methyltransferase [Eubacteriales bacterium]
MSLLKKLPYIIEKSENGYRSLMEESSDNSLTLVERVGNESENILANSENSRFMKYLIDKKGMSGKFDFIYIDPPFYSNSDYGTNIKIDSEKMGSSHLIKQHSYHDTWENGMEEYLVMLTTRFMMMKDLLSDTGSFVIHLDWHVVHYVKIILDEIFGEKNFINEIIWQYKSGGVSKRYFAKKHDNLLLYAKSGKYYFEAQKEKSYNRGFKPYRFKGVKEYKDDLGWYTMVSMKDIFTIDMVGRTSGERTGYATQKPEALMERLLLSCTKEGDLVGDFFSGSSTLAASCENLKRKWICCDMGKSAIMKSIPRLYKLGSSFDHLEDEKLTYIFKNDLIIESNIVEEFGNDKIELEIQLIKYIYENFDSIPIDDKYMKQLMDIAENDSTKLIDYFSIDYSYDGNIFSPDIFIAREKGNLDKTVTGLVNRGNTIAIRAVDVFGNSVLKVIELGGLN